MAIAVLVAAGLIFFTVLNESSKSRKKLPDEPSQNQQITGQPVLSQTVAPSQTSTPMSAQNRQNAFVAAFESPIVFHGRVIDQHNNPIPDANVRFSANDKAFGGRPSEYTRKTDSDGRFSIEGIVGITLAVEVSKQGYQGIPRKEGRVASSGLFEYWSPQASVHEPFHSNKDAPAIFMLYKPTTAETLFKSGEKSVHLSQDGSPVAISLDNHNTHQIIVRCWSNDMQRPQGQQKYDWRFKISVPNGGLVVRNDAFDVEAPESGYTSSDTVDMPASLPFGHGGWSGLADRSYFFRFNDGTFARANIQVHAGGDHFVVWESLLNPTPGSRNLEFDATKQIKVK